MTSIVLITLKAPKNEKQKLRDKRKLRPIRVRELFSVLRTFDSTFVACSFDYMSSVHEVRR